MALTTVFSEARLTNIYWINLYCNCES